MDRYKIQDKKNTMTNMGINIGITDYKKKTPINKGDFEQLIFALGETVGLTISQ